MLFSKIKPLSANKTYSHSNPNKQQLTHQEAHYKAVLSCLKEETRMSDWTKFSTPKASVYKKQQPAQDAYCGAQSARLSGRKFTVRRERKKEFWDSIVGDIASIKEALCKSVALPGKNTSSEDITSASSREPSSPFRGSQPPKKRHYLCSKKHQNFYATTAVFVLKKSGQEYPPKMEREKKETSVRAPEKSADEPMCKSLKKNKIFLRTKASKGQNGWIDRKITFRDYQQQHERAQSRRVAHEDFESKIDAWNSHDDDYDDFSHHRAILGSGVGKYG